jgi:microcystin-dependent protein
MKSPSVLVASDGNGEAVRATVVSPGRSIGSTVIPVNSTTNWPTGQCVITTGTLQPNNTITNAQVMYATASGTSITISSFAPGYSDLGNAAGDVVVIKPTTEWANLVSTIIENLYPVGCIYAETTGVNPGTTFGFGTWTAFGGGRVLVGKGTSDQLFTAGTTGGESNHTLITNEIPSHSHGYNVASNGSGALWALGQLGTDITSPNTNPTGGGAAHNNLQPYVVIYYWTRTA